ncbi:MAG: hypothetical protein ACJA2M_001481 [Polaribacter sp.]|jgi:hypothetical protein
MKFSRSIIIFLFVSSILGAFSYALNRTDGNIYKSFLFTLCFLAIKIGLVTPNIPSKLDHDQLNQEFLSRIQPLPVVLYESRPSGLYMDHIQRAGFQYDLSYHSQSAITKIRAGDSSVTQAAWLLITIWMLQHQSAGFQPVRPVARPPHIEAANNFLFGKPKSESQSSLHLSNSNEISTSVMPTQIQSAKFLKNGKVDLQQAFEEVNRKASMINCENFDCSFERFQGLATECGNCTPSTTREAITILEGEMRGYYKNSHRGDYGANVTGLDYVVEGLGEFANITHVEVKGAVSSLIRPKPTLTKQAKKFVDRINYQKDFWSSKTKVNEIIPHIKPDAYLPESPHNVLALYDLWDVGTAEKSTVSNAIADFSRNDTNLVILNNDRNT